jgi:hypothetical protein
MKPFRKVLFSLLLVVGYVGIVELFFDTGFQGGFEWGLRSVAPTFEEKPTEI